MLPPLINDIKNSLNVPIKMIHQFFTPDFVYSPQGWISQDKSAGWHHDSIVKTQRARWPRIFSSLQGTGPLRTAFTTDPPESTKNSLYAHDVIMSYAYALARAGRTKNSLSILDWGGGIGLYHLLANVLFPDLNVEYFSYDTPNLCKLGREFWPGDTFYEDAATALRRKYDLVISCGALHYSEKWQDTLRQLAKATLRYLFISRLFVTQNAESFVFIHKYYQGISGYKMEAVGWVMNRDELLECAKQAGMELVREFATPNKVYIHKAPKGNVGEQGFLFASIEP